MASQYFQSTQHEEFQWYLHHVSHDVFVLGDYAYMVIISLRNKFGNRRSIQTYRNCTKTLP